KTRLLKQFMAAMEARDEQALRALFAPDAAWTADGGGRVPAAPYPIVGAERIAKLMVGLQERFFQNRTTLHLVVVNGEPGVCVRKDGRVIGIVTIDSDGERILNAYAVVNP